MRGVELLARRAPQRARNDRQASRRDGVVALHAPAAWVIPLARGQRRAGVGQSLPVECRDGHFGLVYYVTHFPIP